MANLYWFQFASKAIIDLASLEKTVLVLATLKDIDVILNTFQSYGHTEVSASYSSHFLSDTLDIYAD